MRAKVYNLEGTKEWVGSYSYQLTMFQFIRSFVAPKNNCETPMDRSIKIDLIMHILTAVMTCGAQSTIARSYLLLTGSIFLAQSRWIKAQVHSLSFWKTICNHPAPKHVNLNQARVEQQYYPPALSGTLLAVCMSTLMFWFTMDY